jgi:hypothetical protein
MVPGSKSGRANGDSRGILLAYRRLQAEGELGHVQRPAGGRGQAGTVEHGRVNHVDEDAAGPDLSGSARGQEGSHRVQMHLESN